MKFLPVPVALVAIGFLLCDSANAAVDSVRRQSDGILIGTDAYTLRLRPWSDGTIRVEAASGKTLPGKTSFAVINPPKAGAWTLHDGTDRVELRTKRLRATLDKGTGLLSFSDGDGKLLFKQEAWSFRPAKDAKRDGLEVGASFTRAAGERFFGGGVIGDDFRQPGAEIALQNDYLQMHIPMLFSTRGYGFFWDNPSRSKLRITPDSVSWNSPAGDLVDFYVMAGPGADAVVKEYRALTGAAPLFPKWAYGFWFSRDAFRSQQEILDAARTFRDRRFPIDLLVQDYFYWKPDGAKGEWTNWGSHEFARGRYPDPKAMIAELHNQYHIHFMPVIWPKLDPALDHGKELWSVRGLFPEHHDWAGKPLRYYDPFNPKARGIYGRQVMDSLFAIGADAFWMDGAEPEMDMNTFAAFDTAAGPGSRVMSAYPLLHTTSMYVAWRARTQDKRVVLLPRSAWAGEQRNGAISWTSDINMDWKTLEWQIEGLQNYSILGLPYINTDIGGWTPTPEADRELFIRWFQYGAFTPIFRAHGSPRPFPWDYGVEAEGILKKFTNLRYRLLPYIYTQAGLVTFANGTILRPLVMDFPGDRKAIEAWDEFLFGSSILVCPVYKSIRESVATLEQITDLSGQPGGVTAAFLPGNETGERKGLSNIFARGDVKGHRDPSVGFRFDGDPTDEQNRAKTVRIDGIFTPKETGDFQIEISGVNQSQAPSCSIAIEGKTVEASTPAAEWQFPAFPFKGEAGKPVRFTITSEMKRPTFRLVRKLPEPAHRDVYLPAGVDWYDFWSGERLPGARTSSVETPLTRIPLYMRAGSILPLGPELQYANEKPADPIELRVYRGASGEFTLYEDEGDSYRYEKGAFATIPIRWDEASKTLTIDKRQGSFPGMLKSRTFRVVWVAAGHGVGGEVAAEADEEVSYSGNVITMKPKH
jgi:alpha-D-xyloside xylohydrolase